jgi:hypothetical protein
MKHSIRTHPKIGGWPPGFGGSQASGAGFPIHEQGILRDVVIYEADAVLPRRIYLSVEYRGNRFGGGLVPKDENVIDRLHAFLRTNCLGKEISEIGSLNVCLP